MEFNVLNVVNVGSDTPIKHRGGAQARAGYGSNITDAQKRTHACAVERETCECIRQASTCISAVHLCGYQLALVPLKNFVPPSVPNVPPVKKNCHQNCTL